MSIFLLLLLKMSIERHLTFAFIHSYSIHWLVSSIQLTIAQFYKHIYAEKEFQIACSLPQKKVLFILSCLLNADKYEFCVSRSGVCRCRPW